MAASTPDPVDIHVGTKVRDRRKSLKFSQHELALAIGLTFQQVQKYERGTNRISASKLYEISQFLKVPVSVFFEGLDGEGGEFPVSGDEKKAIGRFLETHEGLELVRFFARIEKHQQRRTLVELIKTMVSA